LAVIRGGWKLLGAAIGVPASFPVVLREASWDVLVVIRNFLRGLDLRLGASVVVRAGFGEPLGEVPDGSGSPGCGCDPFFSF
jgi:hypothetical protein